MPVPKPKPNPFAAIIRDRAAREKRNLTLPRAADGSVQDIFAIANAALLRDSDAGFEDSVAETSMFDPDDSLDQLAEGGFAGEAERIRRARATMLPPGWTVFSDDDGVEGESLVVFPKAVAGLLQTPRAKELWERITGWVAAKGPVISLMLGAFADAPIDFGMLEAIFDCSLLHTALSKPEEQPALEPL